MSIYTLEIVDGGMLTTVQDLGRWGYQRFGVPISGAMDPFALRAANILVGNEEGAACLEITVLGPLVKLLADTWIALTGGDLTPMLDGEPVPMWRTVAVGSGSVLSFGGPKDGLRAYLAVAGGIDVPVLMGSRSTYFRASMGGYEGRALKASDVLKASEPGGQYEERCLPKDFSPPTYRHTNEVRVVLGPQDAAFTSKGVETLLNSTFKVSMDSDRMGYRLEGPAIEHVSGPDIVSDGTALGAVQVPGDGKPIVLLADRGTTGGYTKIATVISSDIGIFAQAMPGDELKFKAVGVDEAGRILGEQRKVLAGIGVDRTISEATLSVVIDGEAIEIEDEKGVPLTVSEAPGDGGGQVSRRVGATVDGRTFEFEVRVKDLEPSGPPL